MIKSRLSFCLRIGLVIGALLGLWFLRGDFQHLFERDWIDANVRGHGFAGYGIFVAAGALVTAVGLSRQAVAFLGGYAFGAGFGLMLSTLATLTGCVLAFFFARFFGRSLVNQWLSGSMRRFNDFVQRDPFSMTLIIRLLPVGSNLATNLLAGVSQMPKAAFFAGSFVGYLPQLLIFSLAGSGITIGSRWQIAFSLLLLAVSGLLGASLYRKVRRRPDFAGPFDFSVDPEE
ncbi:MAG: putative rane protein [Proteobacteria bacterium]|nr:putative rane protein [Pseudomonadota bacterium]